MMKLLKKIKMDKSGASAAEYALMVAVMGGVVVTAVIALGGAVGTNVNRAATDLARAETGTAS